MRTHKILFLSDLSCLPSFFQRTAILFLCLIFMTYPVMAQDVDGEDLNADIFLEMPDPVENPVSDVDTILSDSTLSIADKAALKGEGINPNQMQPLLFLLSEYRLIQEAERRFQTRPPTAGEINQSQDMEPATIEVGIRELSLSGIVYRSPKDWTIWLNGQRVTPKAIPKEVLDLKVRKSFIEIKWFDEYTNQIFPIRLRPHQRFNIDTRIFLPG